MKKLLRRFAMLFCVMFIGFCGGYIAYAYTIPGWDEPYNPPAYYDLTAISWEDSPSEFTFRDLAWQGGNVFDYTRYIKSVLFAEDFKNVLENSANQTSLDEMNTTPFDAEIFAETSNALNLLLQNTEKVAQTVNLQEMEEVLNQGDSDEWQNFNPVFDNSQKYLWLDNNYKKFVEGASVEVNDLDNVIAASDSILSHSDIAKGDLQIQQARNELLTLLAYELARKNALDSNMDQMQALYQAAEYDEFVRSAYLDSVTKFDVANPYDTENYQLLQEQHGYTKPALVGMPDFK